MHKDIDLNFVPHPLTGDLSTKKDSSAIRQSLVNIVLTDYYERGFFVEFGTDVRGSLFENISPLETQTLKENIIRSIENFEPRVELERLLVEIINEHQISVVMYYTENNNPESKSVKVDLKRLR